MHSTFLSKMYCIVIPKSAFSQPFTYTGRIRINPWQKSVYILMEKESDSAHFRCAEGTAARMSPRQGHVINLPMCGSAAPPTLNGNINHVSAGVGCKCVYETVTEQFDCIPRINAKMVHFSGRGLLLDLYFENTHYTYPCVCSSLKQNY